MKHSSGFKRAGSEASMLIAQARTAFRGGQIQTAEDLLHRALQLDPSSVDAASALGNVAAETGRKDLAIERFLAALEIAPSHVPSLCWLATLFIERDDLMRAEEFAKRALRFQPENVAMNAIVGRCQARTGRYIEAIASLKSWSERDPQNPAALSEYGEVLIQTGHEREAVSVLQRAVRLKPDPKVELKLAYLELGLGRLDEAEKLCQKALTRIPDNASGNALMAKILTEKLRLDEAEAYWNRARELDPTPAAFSLERALSLTAIGDFDAAIAELEASIRAKPIQGPAYQSLAYSKRISEKDRPLVDQMEDLLASGELTSNERLSVSYALGKSYENLGEYERALGFFDRANDLKRSLRGVKQFDRDGFTALIDKLIGTYTKSFYRQFADVGIDSSLPIIVVGMMRSGTTLVEQMLSCHSLVGGAGEQHFWGDHDPEVVDYQRNTFNASELRRYARLFVELLEEVAPGYSRVIDKNPANLQVLGSFHLAFPNARMIHTRRNAIDTAISIWTTPMSTNAQFICDRASIVYAYKEYLRLMEHWQGVFPQDRFIEVRYEELTASPEIVMPRVVSFCGLEWEDACLHPELNVKRIKTPSLWQARQPVYKTSMERWRRYEPWLREFEELRDL